MKHVRNALAIILILILILALPTAAFAATKFTGYISQETFAYKKATTSSSKVPLSVNTKVYVTGTKGKFYKVKNAAKTGTGYVLKNCVSKTKVSSDDSSATSASWKSKVVKLEWSKGGSKVLKRGSYGYLYDIATGITMRIKRMGGTNHADVEPATAADTEKLLKIAGGEFSWNTHAVILHAGSKYVACSINTLPHGDQTITDNNYEGQFCLHMVGSLTHGSGKVNPEHQARIQEAYDWAH